MDKVQKIREEVVKLYNQSLADENRQADRGLERAANVSYGKSKACKELLSFIDSLQEEHVSEEQVKESLISIHDDKTCKEKSNSLTQEPTIPDIVDEHFHEMLGEEPVSKDLLQIRHRDTLDEFAYQCAYDLSNDWAKETPTWHDVEIACKLGANWQKEQMMANTIDAKLLEGHLIRQEGVKHPLHAGDKVKVIVIKED